MANWNIYEQPPPEVETVQRTLTELRSEPVNLTDTAGYVQATNNISFITKNNSKWYDLHGAMLEVRFVIAKAAGGGIDLETVATLGANSGFALFDKMELILGGEDPIDSVDFPQFVHQAYGLAHYSPSQLDAAAENEWFYVEKAKGMNAGVLTAPADSAAGYTAALAQRLIMGVAQPYDATSYTLGNPEYIASQRFNPVFQHKYARTCASNDGVSREVTLMLPLRAVFGFCDKIRHPLRGIPIQLRCTLAENPVSIMHGLDGAANCVPVIRYSSLWIPELTPNAQLSAELDQALYSNASVPYQFENRTVFIKPIDSVPAATGTRYNIKINTLAARPSVVYIGFQNQRQFTEQNDLEPINTAITYADQVSAWSQHSIANPGIFSHMLDITQIELRVNSDKYPDEPYDNITFGDSETYGRAYRDFLSIAFKDNFDMSNVVDQTSWAVSPLWAFKLNVDQELYNKVRTVDLVLNVTVKSTAADATNPGQFRMVAIVYSDRELQYRMIDGKAIMTT